MKLITDASKLSAAITKIGKDSASVDAQIQTALASCVLFAVKDGNTEPLNKLCVTASKGVRHAAMGAWILAHAPVVPQTDKDKAKEAPFVFSRDKVAELVETDKPTAEQAEAYAAQVGAVEWTGYKPEQLVPETFDVHAMLAAMVKKATALAGKGSKPKGADLLAKLKALAEAPSAAQEEAPAPL